VGAIGIPTVPQVNTGERYRRDMASPSTERMAHNPALRRSVWRARMPCPLEEGGQAGHPGRGRFTDRDPRSADRG